MPDDTTRYLRTFNTSAVEASEEVRAWYRGEGLEGAILRALGDDVLTVVEIRERLRIGKTNTPAFSREIQECIYSMMDTPTTTADGRRVVAEDPGVPCVFSILRRKVALPAVVAGRLGSRFTSVPFRAEIDDVRPALKKAREAYNGMRTGDPNANYESFMLYDGPAIVKIDALRLTLGVEPRKPLGEGEMYRDIRMPWKVVSASATFEFTEPLKQGLRDDMATPAGRAAALANVLDLVCNPRS